MPARNCYAPLQTGLIATPVEQADHESALLLCHGDASSIVGATLMVALARGRPGMEAHKQRGGVDALL